MNKCYHCEEETDDLVDCDKCGKTYCNDCDTSTTKECNDCGDRYCCSTMYSFNNSYWYCKGCYDDLLETFNGNIHADYHSQR